MQVSEEMLRAAMSVPRSAFLRADDWWKSALEAALAAMWRPVVGWEGYEVSIDGQVRSRDRIIHGQDGVAKLYRGSVLSQRRNGHRYRTVHLREPGKNSASARVHRLVAEAFIPNPLAKPNVNHIDCDVENNNVSNLEWCTQQENLAHMTNLGRRVVTRGRRSSTALLSDCQVAEIRRLYATGEWSLSRLAEKFEISKRAIGRIVNFETYQDVLPQPPRHKEGHTAPTEPDAAG